MKVRTFRAVSLQGIKWIVVSLGAILLFCAASGFAQSAAKSQGEKETVKTVSPSAVARKKEPVIATDKNGTVEQANFRAKTAGIVRDSEQNHAPQTKTVRIWDACDPD